MTRRKSQPLLPHELYSSFHSSQESVNGNPSSSFESTCVASSPSDLSTTQSLLGSNSQSSHRSSSASEGGFETGALAPSPGFDQVGCTANTGRSSFLSDGADQAHSPSKERTGKEVGQGQSAQNAAQSDTAAFAPKADPESTTDLVTASAFSHSSRPPLPLQRTASSLRLSTSLDGKAQVLKGTGDTPSPPSKPLGPAVFPQRHGLLQRSQSAADFRGRSSSGVANSSSLWPRGSVPGRSRDVRTWEFYCDSDARNALSVQAEQEKKGSALGLLGLIRSGSASSRMQSTPLNPHSSESKHEPGKRKGAVGGSEQQPKIARTTSSVARLQSVELNVQRHNPKKPEYNPRSDSKQSQRRQDPSGESDKENWEPGTQLRNSHRRTLGEQRTVLNETTRTGNHTMRLENLLNREPEISCPVEGKSTDSNQDKENIRIDQEVARFMGEKSLPRREDDLDCVEQLLSLRKGTWQ